MFTELGFPPPHHVEGRATVADLFKPEQRCGIYILHFADGWFYAGQAIDVTRRYVQHRNYHRDIVKLSFKHISQDHLTTEEMRVIRELDHRLRKLRNKIGPSVSTGESDLDLIMSPAEQVKWSEDPAIVDNEGERLVNPDLRRRYQRNYERFRQTPHAETAVNILSTYLRAGIPVIRRGEISFWCLSCMPEPGPYARVNVNWQEVLTAFIDGNDLWFSLHMARTPLERAFGMDLKKLHRRYSKAVLVGHQYQPGGQDQTSYEIPATDAKAFITDPNITRAIRLLNLRLMQKGPCIYGRFHCMDLADRVLADAAIEPLPQVQRGRLASLSERIRSTLHLGSD